MPPIVWLGQQGCWSGRHRHESGHNKRALHLKQPMRRLAVAIHRYSEAEGDQTERALASESRPAKASVRATGTSDDDRTAKPRFYQWQLSQAMFRIQ